MLRQLPGPHRCDVPFTDIVDIVWKAKPHAILFEAANPRACPRVVDVREGEVTAGQDAGAGGDRGASRITSSILSWWLSASSGMRGSLGRRMSWLCGGLPDFRFTGIGWGGSDVVWGKLESLAKGAEIASRKFFG